MGDKGNNYCLLFKPVKQLSINNPWNSKEKRDFDKDTELSFARFPYYYMDLLYDNILNINIL